MTLTSQRERPKKNDPNGKVERAKRATRIPDDFPLTDAMRDWLDENRPDLDPEKAHQEFCTYWRSEARTKSDWLQTWQNGMLKSRMRRAAAQNLRPLTIGNMQALRDADWPEHEQRTV